MDLSQSGKLLYDLRKAKGLTQKEIAEKIGVLPKTVSKWETGKGFPDVSVISSLSDVLGVSERILLSGNLTKNTHDAGNVRRTKIYVCPECGSIMQGMGECEVVCCGKPVEALVPQMADAAHTIDVSEIEDDFFVEMTKEHFIKFIVCIGFDRLLTVRLYPEQDSSVRFPRMPRGKLYYYCSKHGLFECKI